MADHFVGLTDKGKRRETNEDSFIVAEGEKKELVIASVIDGVGGYQGGEIAAEIARNALLETLLPVTGDYIPALIRAFAQANTSIRAGQRAAGGHAQMACVLTCVVADIQANKFYYAHVGDTRLYLLRDKSLVKLSHDQSMVGFLEDSGRLSEDEAMRHPARNEINKALGFEDDIVIQPDFMETGESPFCQAICYYCAVTGLQTWFPLRLSPQYSRGMQRCNRKQKI